MKDMFNYQCKSCGHSWSWAYLFIIKCPKCKQYGCFHDFEGKVKLAHELLSPASMEYAAET